VLLPSVTAISADCRERRILQTPRSLFDGFIRPESRPPKILQRRKSIGGLADDVRQTVIRTRNLQSSWSRRLPRDDTVVFARVTGQFSPT